MRIEDEVWDDEDGDEDKLEVLKAYEYEDETKHGVAIWFDEREEEETQKETITSVRVSTISCAKSNLELVLKSLKRPSYPHRPNPPSPRPLLYLLLLITFQRVRFYITPTNSPTKGRVGRDTPRNVVSRALVTVSVREIAKGSCYFRPDLGSISSPQKRQFSFGTTRGLFTG